VFDAVWDGADVLLRVTSAPPQPTPSPTDEPTGSPTDGPDGDDSGDDSGAGDDGSGDDDGDTLPDTGVWTAGGLALAALLLAGGLLALRARRRSLA
jgi:LPXTG-motif cell wall-anchored protein